MKPKFTHTETIDGIISIKGLETKETISIEGETFEDNIFPMSDKGVHTRFTVKNVGTGALIGNHFVHQKMTQEDLEAQCKLLTSDINNTVNALL